MSTVLHFLEFGFHCFLESISHRLKRLAVKFLDSGIPLLSLKSLLRDPVFLVSLTIHSIESIFCTTVFLAEITVLGGTALLLRSLVII